MRTNFPMMGSMWMAASWSRTIQSLENCGRIRAGSEGYFFTSERELDSPEAFEERPYISYEEFLQEFKGKMAVYLPEDFDWDSYIGRSSYADGEPI